MLDQDEWNVSTKPLSFPLHSVLLNNLHVDAMAPVKNQVEGH